MDASNFEILMDSTNIIKIDTKLVDGDLTLKRNTIVRGLTLNLKLVFV